MIHRLLLLCSLLVSFAGESPLLAVPASVIAFHGQLDGQRFWARLTEAKPEFNGNRVLQLVYTPPEPAKLGGAHLPDCPFVLLDGQLRIVAWNGRDTLSQAVGTANGYRVTREIEVGKDKDAVPDSQMRQVRGPLGWDERIAPVLLALAWRSGSRGDMPTYDLFAAAPTASMVSWQDTQVHIAGRPYQAVADAAGRLARLNDAASTPSLTIDSWIP